MNKIKFNAIVNIISAIFFFFSALSGLILKFFLIRGSGKLGATFFWLFRENWILIHDVSSIGFIILVVLHLLLHLNWIKCLPKLLK